MASLKVCAHPYATAAYEYAKTDNSINQWESSLEILAAATDTPEMQAALLSVHITQIKCAELLIFTLEASSTKFKKITAITNFINLLAEAKKLSLLPLIQIEFMELKLKNDKSVVAQLVSAIPLDAKMYKNINEKLNAKLNQQVDLITKVDPSLLGGILVKIGDRVIDGSIRGQLNSLATELKR